MKKHWFRSLVFNIFFYGFSAVCAIAAIPTLIMPRGGVMFITRVYLSGSYLFEKYILGLDYEVRGREHLPDGNAYIIAAKHQSAYETMKLHKLFGDPAIILKKELLSLPVWGKCLAKTDVIAIDRSTPDSAIQSIQDGARRMTDAGRPIVIFPQGTRVGIDTPPERRPYKIGVVRIQEACGLPIIPMAMNSGYFWPRNSFFKRPGKVIFEFLPPIEAGDEPSAILKQLTISIEDKSNELLKEAMETPRKKRLWLRAAIILFAIYSALWFGGAHLLKAQYNTAINSIDYVDRVAAPIKISGFPARIQIFVESEIINTLNNAYNVQGVSIKAWPLPFVPASVQTDALKISDTRWGAPLTFDSLSASITPRLDRATVNEAALSNDDFKAGVIGEVAYQGAPYPNAALHMSFENPDKFINNLATANIITANQKRMFLNAAQSFLQTDQNQSAPTIPVRVFENNVYVGPFKIFKLR